MKKTIMKRTSAVALAIAVLFTMLCSGCTSGTKYNVKISSETLGLSIETDIVLDEKGFFNQDMTKENENLKKFCFVSCMDVFNNGVAIIGKDGNTDETKNTEFFTALGFENVTEYNIGADATVDVNDTTTIVVGRKLVSDGKAEKKSYLVFVTMIGTMGDTEWASNFDVGADTKGYGGAHTEWTDKDNHKGFDVASNRTVEQLDEYFSEDGIENSDITIVFTGYSRGAAVANVVAAKLIDGATLGENNTFNVGAYTFATPRTTTDKDGASSAKYAAIRNYVNEDDTVTKLPTAEMGFVRYGTDVCFSVQESDDMKKEYKKITNAKYNASSAAKLQSYLGKLFSSREALYEVTEESLFTLNTDPKDEAYTDKAYVEGLAEQFFDEMEERGLSKFFINTGIREYTQEVIDYYDGDEPVMKEVTYYGWSFRASDGLIMQTFTTMVSAALSGDLEKALSDIALANYTTKGNTVMTVVMLVSANTSCFMNAHLPAAYYVGCIK